jgi:hypothetical protein
VKPSTELTCRSIVSPSEQPESLGVLAFAGWFLDSIFRVVQAIRRWIAENPLVALTVFGLTTWGLLSIDSTVFYERIGIAPGDVGLSLSESAAQSAVVAAFTAIVVLLFIMVVGGGRGAGRGSRQAARSADPSC